MIELFGSYLNRCYERLSATFGHRYTALACRPVDHDVVVDLDRLRDALADPG